jgi:flagellar basal body-associated protein FliL
MAEDQEEDDALSQDETDELERLLEGEDDEEAEGSKLQKILANKKVLIIIVVLLLLIIAGVAFFFLQNAKEAEVVPLENKVNEEVSKEEKEEEEEEVKIGKVNIYELEPFFLPLLDDGKETGQFISISANLLMSNSVLGREINKVLPLLRKNIYNILKRKQPSDFTLKRSRTEEIIKKEILTASNALLLSGAGTISDVFFSRFMIK